MAKDVTMFLSWVSQPEMQERNKMGIKVIVNIYNFVDLSGELAPTFWTGHLVKLCHWNKNIEYIEALLLKIELT